MIVRNMKRKSHKLSEETKEKIRKARVQYLLNHSNNPDGGYKRRIEGKMSYLEQWFYDNVILKYNLLDKYDIINEQCVYPYFLDFAFINIKLDVELDGRCHFKNGEKRIEHDIKRDNDLIQQGWKIFRISFNETNENTIKEFLEYLIIEFINILKLKI